MSLIRFKYRYFLFGIKPQPMNEISEIHRQYRYFLFGIKPQHIRIDYNLNNNIVTSFSVSNHNIYIKEPIRIHDLHVRINIVTSFSVSNHNRHLYADCINSKYRYFLFGIKPQQIILY